ncbi:hypothetical protein BCR33DRAFT_711196 [Rhizoclosmatium globosum]|uniref:Chitin-binding type-4 domain-containing protein n=1 Tax=Rhizoclosmatium globosum TaxID=329046 RepID=A0A1Y2D3X5_9FUNG|nr:hypothetical protein BCR33DRAFT_711196 [Rhizoclosmatium globosum]|eukprot:ORY53854.1 hypothetical protein BCR33DRAFT_711196 [Rhizoclosmatium globosum]
MSTSTLILCFLIRLHLVAAHGMMTWPSPRVVAGDASNGFTIARSASADPCHGLSAGDSKTTVSGGSALVDYVITAFHNGGCTVYIDRGSGWESIGSDSSCGSSNHAGQIKVNIPSGDYKAVIRWTYYTDNGSGEVFNTCADVTVSSTGTNTHSTENIGMDSCTQSDDLVCTGTTKDDGFAQCAAVAVQGTGVWFQKSCPKGTGCYQAVQSNPALGILGKITCGPPSDSNNVVVPAAHVVQHSPEAVVITSTSTTTTTTSTTSTTTTTTTLNDPTSANSIATTTTTTVASTAELIPVSSTSTRFYSIQSSTASVFASANSAQTILPSNSTNTTKAVASAAATAGFEAMSQSLSNTANSGLSGGAIAGIVLAVLAVVAAAVGAVLYRRKQASNVSSDLKEQLGKSSDFSTAA